MTFPKFHPKDNWFFQRMDTEGVVKITSHSGDTLVVDPDTWASIVASVSIRGESAGTQFQAKQFHNRKNWIKPPKIDPGTGAWQPDYRPSPGDPLPFQTISILKSYR